MTDLNIGCIIKAGEVTAGGNLYSEECLKKAVGEAQEQISAKAFFGKIFSKGNPAELSLSDASHQVEDLKVEDGELKATTKILATTEGLRLQRYIDQHGRDDLVLVPVGVGSCRLREDGVTEVEDFTLHHISMESKAHIGKRGKPLVDKLIEMERTDKK